MKYTLLYIEILISMVFNFFCMIFFCYSTFKLDRSLRLQSVTITRGIYCLCTFLLMCLQLSLIQKHETGTKSLLELSCIQMGIFLTSSWQLVYEYWVSSNELLVLFNLQQVISDSVKKRRDFYKVTNIVVCVLIWVPILIEMIFF